MTKYFHKENDNDGTSSSSSDDEFTPKYKKSYGESINANINAFMDRRFEELIEADNFLFKNRKIFPKFVLAPFRLFLDSKLYRLSLHQDTQWNPFHTQAAEEIICSILNPGIGAMKLIKF